jgi:hypothetical protein
MPLKKQDNNQVKVFGMEEILKIKTLIEKLNSEKLIELG